MKDRGKRGKKGSTDQSSRSHENGSHEEHNSRFPGLVQRDSLLDSHTRATLREHTHSPRLHVPTSLTTAMPTLFPRPHVTNSQTSTVTQGALLLARNGVSHTELRAAVAPQAPTTEASGGGLRCSTAALPALRVAVAEPSGSMFGRTGKACPRPSTRDLSRIKPLPPADKRPLESSAPSEKLSRSKRPITGKKHPDNSFPINTKKRVVQAQEMSTQAKNVLRAPVPPLQTKPASSILRRQLGRDQRRDQERTRLTDFSYVSADTTECVCLTEDSLASITALSREYQARSRPQQPPPQAPQSPPSPPWVHYTPQPRLLPKRAQMEQRVLKTVSETSKQLPAMSLGGSMVCNIGAEERRRELQQASNKPRAKARDYERPRVILSVLRETQHQQVPIIRRRKYKAASFRTRRFPMYIQAVHTTILEPRVGLAALRKIAKDSKRTRGPVHRRSQRITLRLTMPSTFRLRTRKPIFAHRVVLRD